MMDDELNLGININVDLKDANGNLIRVSPPQSERVVETCNENIPDDCDILLENDAPTIDKD